MLKPEQDRRKKIMPEQLKEMREMFDAGIPQRKIAAHFHCSQYTVQYHMRPDFREKDNKKKRGITMLRVRSEPEFRKKYNKSAAASRRHRYALDPLYREVVKNRVSEWTENNQERKKESMKIWWRKNRERINQARRKKA